MIPEMSIRGYAYHCPGEPVNRQRVSRLVRNDMAGTSGSLSGDWEAVIGKYVNGQDRRCAIRSRPGWFKPE